MMKFIDVLAAQTLCYSFLGKNATHSQNLISVCYAMFCYVIWLFVMCLLLEAIQRRSQRDRQVKSLQSTKETHVISHVASHFVVQEEESHSRVQDPQ